MDPEVLKHLVQRLRESPLESVPYPYFHIKDIFPWKFYSRLIGSLPDLTHFSSSKYYPKRFVLDLTPKKLVKLPFDECLFWSSVRQILECEECKTAVLEKFQPQLQERFGTSCLNSKFSLSLQLVRDQSNYFIGPHTDRFPKAVTLLFYLAKSKKQSHLGTSIYTPKVKGFTCDGDLHHPFEKFDKVSTVPFLPNSVFGFVKTNNSFHGVEPIGDVEEERVSLAYTVLVKHAKV